MKNAFVTGANGFLGINLIRQLVLENWKVTGFHLPEEDTSCLNDLNISLKEGDILDFDSIKRAVPKDPEMVIFHLAGDTTMWSRNAVRQKRINVTGTENMIKIGLERNIRKMIFTSSSSAFGYHSCQINEATVSNALTCRMNYNKTKYLAEIEVKKAVRQGLNAVILNPCNMIGPYDRKGWASLLLSVLENRAPGIPPGTGTFAHVKDIARAHISAVENGETGENYLLGGVEASFETVYDVIFRILKQSSNLKKLSPLSLKAATGLMWLKSLLTQKEPLLTYSRYKRLTGYLGCDDSKARKTLGFSTTSLEEMLKDCHDWIIADHGTEGCSND